ncbi:lipoprotein LpqH [Gordonia sp. UCD-TK1]|uniref:lipoprotein LpqH n=1 Tax=Gordonia sp. UCD-TK1 TaxID=1857893 RepID=UPI0011121D3A|nr:lipoprotein LpqH [Gordonia sp. UCD-TK1]
MPLLVASWVGLVVARCSESDASEAADTRPELSKIDIPYAELSVTVDGQPLPGIDPAEFMCYRQSDSISITGQDPTDGQPGLIADLQAGNPPKLVRVSFGLDGVLYTAKRGKGSVEDVYEDGSRIRFAGPRKAGILPYLSPSNSSSRQPATDTAQALDRRVARGRGQ